MTLNADSSFRLYIHLEFRTSMEKLLERFFFFYLDFRERDDGRTLLYLCWEENGNSMTHWFVMNRLYEILCMSHKMQIVHIRSI